MGTIKKITLILSAIVLLAVMLTSCGGDKAKEPIVLTDSAIGEDDGYSYELWKDYGDTTMSITGDGKFSCEWSNINNCLFRIGRKFDCTKTYREIGNIELKYDVDYNPDGNSYLCLYGWTREPLIEYYVVESWGNWRPPGGNPVGTITVDGGVYDVYRTLRVNQPSIDGNTTFEQYWSVRQEKSSKGTVSAASHFAAWEGMGMPLGKLYEAALTVEGYQSAGKADVLKNELKIGGKIPDVEIPEPPAPEETDADGYYFHSTFESGNDGWASRGSASIRTVQTERFEGQKALFVTGRQESWNGTSRDLSVYTYIPGNSYSFSAMVMQNKSDSLTFKLTLQYDTSSGTSYDCIVEKSASKGEWIELVNTEYTIPDGARNLILYIETDGGTDDFFVDEATGAPASKAEPQP